MRKFLFAVLVAFLGFAPAHADKMVNVEYIHKLIEQRWDISIPYSPKLSTPKVAANMKYLLTLVDMTNKRINGVATTHYGDGEFATMAAADTIAANRAITKLARIKPKFTITTTPGTTEFSFNMTAAGRFMVDWGDNTATQIVRDNTERAPYMHTYKKPGEYKIKMTGRATGYSAVADSVSFAQNTNIAKIEGSLGAIFPTIGDGVGTGKQPGFQGVFSECINLSGKIPAELFAGIHGAPRAQMFRGAFQFCTSLTGPIPADLFSGISGAPAKEMFFATFYGSNKLSGPIPAGLFKNISGQPATGMFYGTFYNCSGLTGEIPADMFGDIYGQPAQNMFDVTFLNCSGLTGSVPAGLFGNIYGDPADKMYRSTFVGCKNLTGCIPDGLFGDVGMTLDEILTTYSTFNNTSGVTTEYCSVLDPKFFVTVRVGDAEIGADTNEFKFNMSARGLFKIDWGDGKTEIVNRTDTTNATYSHEYDTPGEYKIGIGGYATGYNTGDTVPAISFADAEDAPNATVAGISGSLGAIFSTLDGDDSNANQPKFHKTFYKCVNLSGAIPKNLFTGIHGEPTKRMFYATFFECANLTGSIPEKLFGDLQGAPTNRLFSRTFYGCHGLTGEIPADLFAGISGEPVYQMFLYTFFGCSGLEGEIPKNLFAGIKGTPAENMFFGTFNGCSGLTGSIPAGLFGQISGAPATEMYTNVFYNCNNLTGCVPDGLFGDVGMTLDEIIAEYAPFSNATKITPEYCPVDNSAATE